MIQKVQEFKLKLCLIFTETLSICTHRDNQIIAQVRASIVLAPIRVRADSENFYFVEMRTRRRTRDAQDDVQHYFLDAKRKSIAIGSESQGLESSKVK